MTTSANDGERQRRVRELVAQQEGRIVRGWKKVSAGALLAECVRACVLASMPLRHWLLSLLLRS